MADVWVYLAESPHHVGPMSRLPDGSPFPEWLEVGATVDGEVGISLRLVLENGTPVLDRIEMARPHGAGKPLTASRIHAVPVDGVVQKAITLAADHFRGSEDSAGTADLLRAHGRRSITDELLREVASVVAKDTRGKPNLAVQTEMHTSSRNATRWIKAAKERGFLSEGATDA